MWLPCPFNITESNHIEFSYRLAKPAGTLCTSFCLCYRHDACAARRFGGGKLPAGRGRFRTIYEFLGGRPLRPDMAGNYVLADRAGRLYALPNVTLTVSEIRISFSLIFALFRYLRIVIACYFGLEIHIIVCWSEDLVSIIAECLGHRGRHFWVST